MTEAECIAKLNLVGVNYIAKTFEEFTNTKKAWIAFDSVIIISRNIDNRVGYYMDTHFNIIPFYTYTQLLNYVVQLK